MAEYIVFYHHRNSELTYVGAHGKEYLPAAVFRGVREPSLSIIVSHTKFSKLMPEKWITFWRRDMASVDTVIFDKWLSMFTTVVPKVCNHQKWIILFHDALRSYMSYYAI